MVFVTLYAVQGFVTDIRKCAREIFESATNWARINVLRKRFNVKGHHEKSI